VGLPRRHRADHPRRRPRSARGASGVVDFRPGSRRRGAGAVVSLPAGSVWRAVCWVKTENLNRSRPHRHRAALHIQTDGATTLARGPSTLARRVEESASCFVCRRGQGQGGPVLHRLRQSTGQAWFDDVRLEALSAAAGDDPDHGGTPDATADRRQAGRSVHRAAVQPHSQPAGATVANTSFEEDPPGKSCSSARSIGRIGRGIPTEPCMWHSMPSTPTSRSTASAACASVSAPQARPGSRRTGSTEAGRSYTLRLHLRSQGRWRCASRCTAAAPWPPGPRRSARRPSLAHGGHFLRATRTLENATLTLDFAGPGTLWLDRVSLIARTRCSACGAPTPCRPFATCNPGSSGSAGSALETYEWDQCLARGTRGSVRSDLLAASRRTSSGRGIRAALPARRAEPLVCLRWTARSPPTPPRKSSYFNGDRETPMGRRRAQNGQAKP